MARHGILLLSFGFILLAFKQVSTTPIIVMSFVPPPPDFLCLAARIILIFVLMVAAIWIRKYISVVLNLWLKISLYFLIVLLLFLVVWLIPPLPVLPQCCFTALGVISLFASLVFIPAILYKWLAGKLENFLEHRQPIYWLIVFFVYSISWLKVMLSVPAEGFAFSIIFWISFAWFCTIYIIWLNASWQTRKPE